MNYFTSCTICHNLCHINLSKQLMCDECYNYFNICVFCSKELNNVTICPTTLHVHKDPLPLFSSKWKNYNANNTKLVKIFNGNMIHKFHENCNYNYIISAHDNITGLIKIQFNTVKYQITYCCVYNILCVWDRFIIEQKLISNPSFTNKSAMLFSRKMDWDDFYDMLNNDIESLIDTLICFNL